MRYRSHQVIHKGYQEAFQRRELGAVRRYGAGEHGATPALGANQLMVRRQCWCLSPLRLQMGAGPWPSYLQSFSWQIHPMAAKSWWGKNRMAKQDREKLSNTATNKGSSCCNKAHHIILPLRHDSYFLLKTASFQKTVFKSLLSSHNITL